MRFVQRHGKVITRLMVLRIGRQLGTQGCCRAALRRWRLLELQLGFHRADGFVLGAFLADHLQGGPRPFQIAALEIGPRQPGNG